MRDFKTPLILVFSALMLWDVITTCLGVITLLGGVNTGSVCISILFSAFIWSLNFYTIDIWEGIGQDLNGTTYSPPPSFPEVPSPFPSGFNKKGNTPFIIWILRPFWIFAFIFDFYTSWQGNKRLLMGISENNSNSGVADLLIIFFTLATTFSPMIVYWLLRQRK
jgi:hypothetical protein